MKVSRLVSSEAALYKQQYFSILAEGISQATQKFATNEVQLQLTARFFRKSPATASPKRQLDGLGVG